MLSRRFPGFRILVPYQSNERVGTYNRILVLLEELASRGWIIDHIACWKGKTLSRTITYHEVKYLPFIIPSPPFLLQSLFISLQIARKNCIHIFLVYREIELLIGLLIKKLTRCRLILYRHGDSIAVQQFASDSIFNKTKVFVMKMWEKILLPKVDLIITVSQDAKSRILRRVNIKPDKVKVVYNNILARWSSRPTQLLTQLKKEEKKLIGYVGHFSRLKGVETLLYAFSLLSKTNSDIMLILVGDGPTREHLQNLTVDLGIKERVISSGWVRNPQDYIRDFDVLVVPSLYEGCPSVILEALSLGIPVLGSKAGGIPELFLYDELMFQPLDHKELARKLEALLASSEYYARIKKLLMRRKKIFVFDHTSVVEQLLLETLSDKLASNETTQAYTPLL